MGVAKIYTTPRFVRRLVSQSLNDYFSNVAPNLAGQINTSNLSLETDINKAESEFTAFKPVTVNHVYQLLLPTGLSSNKATGVDTISNKIIKIASPAISDSLMHIFNQAITL